MPVATNATPNVIGGTPVTNGIATQPMPLATHSIIQNLLLIVHLLSVVLKFADADIYILADC